MALADKLKDWTEAGLITPEAAASIRAFEEERARPIWLWAVAGLGGLALVLGIIAVIASNWADIPAWLKLTAHFALTAGAAYAAWRGHRRGDRWVQEIALFLLAGLVLGGLALQSQVYQLTGELWPLLLTWLLASGPALLAFGQTRLTAYAFSGMSLWAFISTAAAVDGTSAPELLLQGAAMALPWLFVAIGAAQRNRLAFGSGMIEAGLIVILPAVSLAHLAWAGDITASDAGDMLVRLIPVAAAAAGSFWLLRRSERMPRGLPAALLLGTFAALALSAAIPHSDWWGARLIGAFIFFAMWGAIGWASMRPEWRALFGLSIAAVAIRIFIIFFELFGTMATTGIGLIIAGLLLIGLAFAGRRVFREVAA